MAQTVLYIALRDIQVFNPLLSEFFLTSIFER